jgi:hypothetical protein
MLVILRAWWLNEGVDLMFNRNHMPFALVSVVLLIVAAISLGTDRSNRVNEDPFTVVQAYLKASYARDYPAAYRYISSTDQRVWDEKSYARQYGTFTGFALRLAQRLAEDMKVSVIDRRMRSDRIHYEVGYEVPTADELSSLLFDWNQDKLNALSPPQQEQLLKALEKLKRTGKMITIKGKETFDLIPDGGHWKIFYDWASANKVNFTVALPPHSGIDAQLLNDELLVKKDEPFQIELKIKNSNKHAVVARIVHRIEPRSLENDIEMIACGGLLPVMVQAGDTQEISSAYLIRDGIRPGMKFAINYEIKIEAIPPNFELTNTPKRTPATAVARGLN